MEKEKMSLHRALAELKLLDSRIERGINSIVSIGVQQTGRKVNQHYDQKEFEDGVKADFQSITDLIARRQLIKSAIVQANALNDVTIGGEVYKIAEAINQKVLIDAKKQLVAKLSKDLAGAKAITEKNNTTVDANALSVAQATLNRENAKSTDEDALKLIEAFVKQNAFHLVDPLGLENKIKTMTNEIEAFESNIDSALSEINATTFIEI
jgi:hypothetical protein